ncbi:MAG: YiiD C-terminal domain-containing protein [Pseudoxanthomonas sp.]
MNAASAALADLDELCRGMPPVAAMQVRVDGYDGHALALAAPLAANVNDKGTAFGGSLVSLMTLAGWGLCTLKLEEAGLHAEVYVADSQVRYLAPLRADLRGTAVLAPGQEWTEFVDAFARRGKARVQVQAQVALPGGGPAATLEGRYVAIAKD